MILHVTGDRTAPVLTVTQVKADGATILTGNLKDGYTLPTTNVATLDHTLQWTASVEPLQNTYFGLTLVAAETTVSAAQLEAYYTARGVPEPYLGYLKLAANSDKPFVYIKGSSVTLVDAAKHDLAAGNPDVDMTVPDNFPLGAYTVRGVIKDLAGNPTTVTLILHVSGDRTAPVLTVSQVKADGATVLAGNLKDGYTLPTTNVATLDHTLQWTASVEPLQNAYFGLTLVAAETTVSAAQLEAYYTARGVPEPYLGYLKLAANGDKPFVYIKGSSVTLVDAAKHDLAAGNPDVDMTVPDNFPLGTYTVRGVIQDLAGNPTTVTLILHITGDRTAPQTTIDSKPADPWGSSSATFGFSSNEPGSTFECKLDDGAFAPCASPKTYENLAEGSHTFQARATDGAGNTDATPANHTWTVDYAPCGGDPSLVACYLLDEGSGGTAYDGGAAPANNATLTGSPTWVAGVAGGALRFNGSTQYGSTPDEASLDIVNQITIVAWIKPETTSGTPQDLVKKAVNSVTNGYELTLASTGSNWPNKVFGRINQVASGDTYRVNSDTQFPTDGSWMHAAMTYDGAVLRLYINGVEEDQVAATVPILTNDLALTIGAQSDAQRFFQGAMDDARVYNRALSAEEILALFGAQHPPVANPDSFSTPQNTALNVAAPGVLGNDTDPDGNSLTAVKASDPTHGALTLNSDGSFTYTPAAGFSGADSFAYKANDGKVDSNVATVTISVGAATGLTCVNLNPVPLTAGTGEKPQSKVWQYDGAWWAVFPTGASGPNAAGTWLWKLQDTTWTRVLSLSAATNVKADVKVVGSVVHALLYAGTNTQLVSVQYAGGTYQPWAARPAVAPISLPNSEIATIDLDTQGRMWLASENDATDQIVAYYSDSPYSTWSGPVTVASGVNDDDIALVTRLPGLNQIGVLWSNQNTQRFGFRKHADDADPSTWSADEVPASQSALNVGAGMADDHINVATTSDGTLYAAVKTSYDTAGYPKIALLVRRPGGTWDNLYEVAQSGTRAIVEVDEANGVLNVIYTSTEGYANILYRQSPLSTITFGPESTLRSGAFNDASSAKDNYTAQLVVIFGSSSEVAGELCRPAGAAPNPPQVTIKKVGVDVELTWLAVTKDVNNTDTVVTRYQVYRSLKPYFRPGDDSSLLPLAQVSELKYTDWGTIDALDGQFYVVRAVNAVGPSTDSNRTGKFSYGLTKGTAQ